MYNQNTLSNLLQKNNTLLGTWNLIGDPLILEILGAAGFDFAIIDMEHGAHSFSEATNLIRAAESVNLVPLLRPPGVDESSILRALDSGAHGLMVPNINSISQVENLINFAFYPPIGSRGHSPFTRSGMFDYSNCTARMQDLNKNLFLGILIEGEGGMNALNEILDKFSDFIDVIYVGLYDLAKTLGCPGDLKNQKVLSCIENISKICNARSVYIGILVNDDQMYKNAIDCGVKFICYQNDTGIILEAAKTISKKYKS